MGSISWTLADYSHMHMHGWNFVQPNAPKQVLLITNFVAPVSQSANIFFLLIMIWNVLFFVI